MSIAAYDASKVLQFRRISEANVSSLPKPILRLDDRGAEVEKLQIALNILDYRCGDPDGDFGPKTLAALKLFQANNQLKVDGVFGEKSASILLSLVQE